MPNGVAITRERSPLAPDRSAPSCAGQGCEERERCVKYRRYTAFLQCWASFDIERLRFGGECPSFERLTFIRRR